ATNWAAPVTGPGSINVTSGTFNLSGATSGTITGGINVGVGATVNYGQAGSTLAGSQVTGSGTFTFTSAVTVSGTYTFSGQTQIQSNTGAVQFTGTATINNFNFINGTLGGIGSVTISGQWNWTGGTLSAALTLSPTATATLASNDPNHQTI